MGLLDKLKKQIEGLPGNLQEKVTGVRNSQIKNEFSYNDYQPATPEPVHEQVMEQTPQVAPPPPIFQPVVSPMPQPPVPPQPVNNQSEGDKNLYGDYMEKLIEMALTDGELTEKEKQVLFKKAEANGIDLDEFEMVLDARLYERQKAMQAPAPVAHAAAPKSDKYGDVKKCPNCGAIIESFVARCADCGYEFRNIGTTSSFTLLSTKLEALENQKTGKFWSSHDDNIEEKKADLINGFPVPTTKEDILEFLSMGAPLANTDSGSLELEEAWKNKCNQVIMKARFSMKDDKKLMAEIDKYDQQINANAIDKAMNQVNKILGFFKK